MRQVTARRLRRLRGQCGARAAARERRSGQLLLQAPGGARRIAMCHAAVARRHVGGGHSCCCRGVHTPALRRLRRRAGMRRRLKFFRGVACCGRLFPAGQWVVIAAAAAQLAAPQRLPAFLRGGRGGRLRLRWRSPRLRLRHWLGRRRRRRQRGRGDRLRLHRWLRRWPHRSSPPRWCRCNCAAGCAAGPARWCGRGSCLWLRWGQCWGQRCCGCAAGCAREPLKAVYRLPLPRLRHWLRRGSRRHWRGRDDRAPARSSSPTQLRRPPAAARRGTVLRLHRNDRQRPPDRYRGSATDCAEGDTRGRLGITATVVAPLAAPREPPAPTAKDGCAAAAAAAAVGRLEVSTAAAVPPAPVQAPAPAPAQPR